jgi:cyclophilin family peptidyl-prolyl cis-trans isomerase
LVQGRKWSDGELNSFEAQRGSKFTPEQREAYKTLGGTPHLDGGYTVYGEVIQGLEIIDMIATVKTAPGDRPIEDVKIVKAVVVQ